MSLAEIDTVDEHGAQVQAMFSDIAHGYDRANRIMSAGTDVRWRRRAVSSLLPEELGVDTQIGSGARILDLCAGTLDSTLEIHRRYPEADLIGGDFSAGMLATGERRVADLGGVRATAKISAQHMDAHSLPIEDASLDAIFCAFGARNLSDLDRASREQLRCLRPGGQLVVLEFFRPTAWATRAFHTVYNRTVLPVVGWACTGNIDAYRYLPRSIGAMRTASEYRGSLEELGFEAVSVETLTFGVASIVRARRPALAAALAPESESESALAANEAPA